MARRVLWAHLLGYNLVRQGGRASGLGARFDPSSDQLRGDRADPRRISPLAARQHRGATAARVQKPCFEAIATHKVGNRPGRDEPRRLKRRHNKYSYLRMRREQARARHCAWAGTNALVDAQQRGASKGGACRSPKIIAQTPTLNSSVARKIRADSCPKPHTVNQPENESIL